MANEKHKKMEIQTSELVLDNNNARQVVLLIQTSSIRDMNQVCLKFGLQTFLSVQFNSQSIYGYYQLYQTFARTELAAMQQKVYNEALFHSSPHSVVGKRKTKTKLPHHALFQVPGGTITWIPLVITVNFDCARDAVITPRWIRHMMIAGEARTSTLIYLNAYVSTLGGGHYLCKHVKAAWAMALRQQAIAIALEDLELAAQCRIHLAYICMQIGKLKSARARVEKEKAFAKEIGSNKLAAVVFAAEVYLRKLQQKKHELRQQADDKLRDSLYRQRFVDIRLM
jgi:hypothetical protein